MDFRFFEDAERTALLKAMIGAGLATPAQIDAMFSGVDQSFIAASDPGGQGQIRLTVVFNRMNGVRNLRSGVVPMEQFLSMASLVGATTPAAAAIDAAHERVSKGGGVAPAGAAVPDDVLGAMHLELKIGETDESLPVDFLVKGAAAARSVCRVVVPRYENGQPVLGNGNDPVLEVGSGWVIGPRLLITNHHVVNARQKGEAAPSLADLALQGANAQAEFDYVSDKGERTAIKMEKLEVAVEDLDFALLRLAPPAADRTPLVRRSQPILKAADARLEARVNVLGHPQGDAMRLGFRDNFVVQGTAEWLSYLTDTQGGNSGSPVFDDGWTVVALHRGWRSLGQLGVKLHDRTIRAENYGVPIVRILDWLKKEQPALHAEIAGAS